MLLRNGCGRGHGSFVTRPILNRRAFDAHRLPGQEKVANVPRWAGRRGTTVPARNERLFGGIGGGVKWYYSGSTAAGGKRDDETTLGADIDETTTTTTHDPRPSDAATTTTTTTDENAYDASGSVTSKSSSCSALDPSSSPHHDLASFHAHARRTGLSPSSTVYTGTAYEYLTQTTLRSYGFDLCRVGGRGDRGIDLIGVWRIPRAGAKEDTKDQTRRSDTDASDEVETLKVLVQCKRLVGKHARIGPNLVRELDGTVRGARVGALFEAAFPTTPNVSTAPTIGILVGTRPATKGVMEGMRRSGRPLAWVMMEEVVDEDGGAGDDHLDMIDHRDLSSSSSTDTIGPPPLTVGAAGRVKQILWNQAARELGPLADVDVVRRHDAAGGRDEVVLMRRGRVWGGGSG